MENQELYKKIKGSYGAYEALTLIQSFRKQVEMQTLVQVAMALNFTITPEELRTALDKLK